MFDSTESAETRWDDTDSIKIASISYDVSGEEINSIILCHTWLDWWNFFINSFWAHTNDIHRLKTAKICTSDLIEFSNVTENYLLYIFSIIISFTIKTIYYYYVVTSFYLHEQHKQQLHT